MVAEHLNKGIYEIEHDMPVEEFYSWLAWIQYKNEEEKKAAEKAKKGRKR